MTARVGPWVAALAATGGAGIVGCALAWGVPWPWVAYCALVLAVSGAVGTRYADGAS